MKSNKTHEKKRKELGIKIPDRLRSQTRREIDYLSLKSSINSTTDKIGNNDQVQILTQPRGVRMNNNKTNSLIEVGKQTSGKEINSSRAKGSKASEASLRSPVKSKRKYEKKRRELENTIPDKPRPQTRSEINNLSPKSSINSTTNKIGGTDLVPVLTQPRGVRMKINKTNSLIEVGKQTSPGKEMNSSRAKDSKVSEAKGSKVSEASLSSLTTLVKSKRKYEKKRRELENTIPDKPRPQTRSEINNLSPKSSINSTTNKIRGTDLVPISTLPHGVKMKKSKTNSLIEVGKQTSPGKEMNSSRAKGSKVSEALPSSPPTPVKSIRNNEMKIRDFENTIPNRSRPQTRSEIYYSSLKSSINSTTNKIGGTDLATDLPFACSGIVKNVKKSSPNSIKRLKTLSKKIKNSVVKRSNNVCKAPSSNHPTSIVSDENHGTKIRGLKNRTPGRSPLSARNKTDYFNSKNTTNKTITSDLIYLSSSELSPFRSTRNSQNVKDPVTPTKIKTLREDILEPSPDMKRSTPSPRNTGSPKITLRKKSSKEDIDLSLSKINPIEKRRAKNSQAAEISKTSNKRIKSSREDIHFPSSVLCPSRSTRSSKNALIPETQSKKITNSKHVYLSQSEPCSSKSRRHSRNLEIPKTPQKDMKSSVEDIHELPFEPSPDKKRRTISSKNIDIPVTCKKIKDSSHDKKHQLSSKPSPDLKRSTRSFQLGFEKQKNIPNKKFSTQDTHLCSCELISKKKKNKRRSESYAEISNKKRKNSSQEEVYDSAKSSLPLISLATSVGNEKKRGMVKDLAPDKSPFLTQKRIDDYIPSPKSAPIPFNTKSSDSDLGACGSRKEEQNVSLDSSVEYDSKVEITHKVNKLFVNDLRYPNTSPFGLINFSCSSVTGCSRRNHLNQIEQLSKAEEEILMFTVYEKCWDLLIHPLQGFITENVHLTPALFRSIFFGIIDAEDQEDNNTSSSLVKIIKSHLELHPPCRKELKKFYKTVLLDPINIGDHIIPVVHYSFPNIIDAIDQACYNISNQVTNGSIPRKTDPELEDKEEKPLPKISSLNGEDLLRISLPEEIMSFPQVKYKKEEEQAQNIKNSDSKLERLFLIFSLSLDILEENFRMWWMKYRYKLKETLENQVFPIIVDVGWKKNDKKGSINEHCVQIFTLFKECPLEYKHHLSRYITLLFQVAQINEDNEELKFPFFNNLCYAFAAELTEHLRREGEPDESTLAMIQCINPPWLRFRICSILLKSDVSSGGRNILRSAYRIVLRNLTPFNTASVKHLRIKSTSVPHNLNTKDLSGQTVLHKVCQKGKDGLLRDMLIKKETNVNIEDNEGWTPLHNAAFYNSVDCVKLLIKYRFPPIPGAEELNINALNSSNDTPLILAIQQENFEIIDILLNHGAGCSIWNKNVTGSSAYDIAPSNLKEKLTASWKSSIASFEYLQMTPMEVDLLCSMISAYCSAFHIKEKVDEDDVRTSKPDEHYKYDYACYFKDEITFERLILVIRRLCAVPTNPKNLKSLLEFLTSHC